MADDAASYGSRGGLVNRRGGARTSQDSTPANMHEPGQPIGYLSARGTPYEKKYFTKKLGFCCLFLAPPIAIVTMVITLVPVLWAIANHALHTAQMHIYASNITAPGNSSFPLTIEGQVKKTGIFPAHLYFRKPVDVFWMSSPNSPGGMRELHLGSLKLGQIGAAAGHARIKQATTFDIVDEEGFGEFAEYLITQEEFTWQLRCDEVHAEAFSFFPTYKPFNFVKNVVIKGINGFEDIKIINLQLPGDDPAGGITVQTITQLVNPSPFGVQVGNLAMDLFYKGMYLGPVTTQNLNLTSGVNMVSLNGRLISHANNQTELDLLGELFTNYINGDISPVIARGVSTSQADGTTIGWLSRGIKALEAEIPFQSPEPIEPIKGIGIEYLSLIYSADRPWNPDVFSNDLTGIFALPFGFSLNIFRLAATLNLEYQGAPVGTIEGPYAESATNITTLSTGETSGTISISLPQSQLLLPNNTDDARQQLVRFQNAFTFGEEASFTTRGSARTLTDTPLGRVLLNGIRFNVTTGLKGLQGLVKYPTIINSVNVVGGTPEGVSLDLALTLVNPSNLNLTVGDSTFNVVNGVPLGTATLPNLNLKIGRNDVNSTSFFDPNRDPKGLETLNRFISGLDTTLNITGFEGSSNIESLAPTFAPLRLNATLPGLQTPLIRSANLTVLPTTGITDDVANSIVALANPFSAPLTIQRIQANASANGVLLATIDTTLNFPAPGNAVTGSPNVPLSVNLFPPDIFAVLRSFAIQAGLNPAYIDGVVALGGFTLSPTTPVSAPAPAAAKRDESFIVEDDNLLAHVLMGTGENPGMFGEDDDSYVNEFEEATLAKRALPLPSAGLAKRANLYTGFVLTDYVREAFRNARADLAITSDTLIGEYGTTLTFSQQQVALGTDDTLFLLLPVLAGPIVQKIVDGAVLNIDRVTITQARPTSFTANLQGSLTNSGPFDGSVSFPQGLTIYYEGRPLTQTAFPNITLTGDLGAAISVELEGTIPDVPFFTEFLKTAIAAPSFLWNIRGEGIVVDALGISVPNVTLNKDVQLTGLNGLKGQVIINSFDLPANAPEGGISLTAVSTINNPAQVGVALSRFGVQISRNGTVIGPSAASQPFTLQALAVTTVPLAGRLLPQQGAGLDVLSEVFTNFVQNRNTPLVIEGDYAGPEDVVWLNEGIRSLRVEASLPSQDFDVIRLISINQLSLFFTKPTEWAPLTDSSDTEAHFFLPFAVPIDIKTVEGPFIARYNDVDIATLNIPNSNAMTEVEARIINLMFRGVPFSVFNNGRTQFSQFVADTTAREQITFNLHGTATSDAQTGAGMVRIRDIPFDLNTNLLGLQNLNARPAIVSDLDVKRGYPDRLEITVMVALFNPSDLTIATGDVNFQVRFQDRPIGEAVITGLTLVPGENRVPTLINYMPRGAENMRAGQTLLENYVSNITSASVVQGTRDTTDIASLQQALAGITLNTDIPGLGKLIVQQANLVVPRDIAQNGGIAQTSVVIANPFTASISLLQIYAQAIYDGIVVGTIDTRLNPPIFAPGRSTTQSQSIPIKLDLNPKTLVRFILAAARNTGTSLGPYPPFLQRILDLPNTDTSINPVPDDSEPACSGGFDLRAATLQALRGLTTTIPIRSVQKIDEYQTNLNFVQSPVPTVTDNSVLYLLGPAGAPLIQLIVDESVLRVDVANATSINNNGFLTSLAGALIADTPAAAQIEFNEPLTVEWQGSIIADISLPPLCVQPPEGIPNLRSAGQLTIRNQRRFTDFAIFLLANPSFQWTLSSDKVTVRSLGIRYENVKLSKTITLDGFNGLPGVTISKFNAPSDAPGRINIETLTQIPSPASLGVELGMASFDLFFRGTNLGEASSTDLFLAAKSTTESLLRGFLRRQSGQGLENVGILFSQYLAGQNTTLQVRGKQVITPASGGQPVKWLSDAFKTLTLNVVLPGQIFKIIYGIVLSDLTVEILNESNEGYTAIVSNNQTIARFANPFGFGLGVAQAGVNSVIEYEGDAARLNLKKRTPVRAGVSRGPDDIQELVLDFNKEQLVAIDRGSYQRFLARTTNFPEVDFGLKGTTDVTSITEIGNVVITGIPFNVTSNLDGINSFNKVADVANVVVSDATSDYISILLDATVENPSDITLFTNNVRLPITKDGVEVGRAYISPLTLYPGTNVLKTDFRYSPSPDTNPIAQGVVQSYLQPPPGQENGVQRVNLKIQGRLGANPTLSDYEALELALAGTEADTELVGIGSRIVLRVDNYITFNTLIQSFTTPTETTIEASLVLTNDLPLDVTILSLSSDVFDNLRPEAGLQAKFTYTYKTPFRTPGAPRTGAGPRLPGGYTSSERVTGIRLQNGLLGALPLVGHPLNVNNVIRASVTGKSGTYILPSLKYDQVKVPADYFLELVPGLPIKLNAIGDLLTALNGLTGDLLFKLLDAIGKLSTGQIPNTILSQAPVAQTICNLEDRVRVSPVLDPLGLLNFGIDKLEELGCGNQLRRIAVSSSASAASSSSAASAASASANPTTSAATTPAGTTPAGTTPAATTSA